MRRLIVIAFSMLLLFSCSSIDCPLNNKVMCMYEIGGSDVFSDTLTVTTEHQADEDTILINRLTESSSFSLPMSYHGSRDVLVFSFKTRSGTTVVDTVKISKESNPHFVSVECSPSYFHTLLSVETTNNYIDSIRIENPKVNYDTTKPNVKVYFKK